MNMRVFRIAKMVFISLLCCHVIINVNWIILSQWAIYDSTFMFKVNLCLPYLFRLRSHLSIKFYSRLIRL